MGSRENVDLQGRGHERMLTRSGCAAQCGEEQDDGPAVRGEPPEMGMLVCEGEAPTARAGGYAHRPKLPLTFVRHCVWDDWQLPGHHGV